MSSGRSRRAGVRSRTHSIGRTGLHEMSRVQRRCQVPVRRGNDPHIGFQHARAAQAAGTLVPAGRARTSPGRSALISLTSSRNSTPDAANSSWPGFGGDRACERAALVAKELGLEELFRQGRAVDRDKRPVVTSRCAMNEPGHDFLAGTRLAEQQDGGVRRGDLRRLLQHLLPRRRLADDPPMAAKRIDLRGEQRDTALEK